MLCFRYSLVATADEQRLLSIIYLKIDAFRLAANEGYFILSSVDMDDARNVLQAYINRMTPASAGNWFSPWSNDLLVEFIGQDVMIDLIDLMPQLLFISLSSIWRELDQATQNAWDLSNNNELIRHATFTFDIARYVFPFCLSYFV